jgi:hypothetical protein
MKVVHWRFGALGAALLAAASTGCTDEQTGFFILGNVVLEAGECVARAESDATLHTSGIVDVALRPEYEATLLVGSQLTPRGDKGNLRTETMIATITGAEVHLYRDTGELDGAPFTVPATGVIRPEASDDAGFGIITATLIPAATGISIAAELTSPAEISTRIAEVIVFGRTIGGLEIESSPFSYVIRACEGCLIEFPVAAYEAMTGSCTAGATEDIASPCRFGQDDSVDCRLCSGSNPACYYFPGIEPPP